PHTVTIELSTLILHDALPISGKIRFVSTGSEANETALFLARLYKNRPNVITREYGFHGWTGGASTLTRIKGVRSGITETEEDTTDRKSTRLNSSHVSISYAVF